MSKSPRRTYRTGLSREIVVDAAVALTVERGLDGWSMRDLTAYLDTSLSVIYHHVGDKERVCASVVDRIYAGMNLAVDESDWRTLLHDVLTLMIDHLARYPGVASWLLRNGPQTELLLPLLDVGVTRMLEAGWGDEAAIAYSFAFNTCLGAIALGDLDVSDPDSGLVGLGRMLESHPSTGSGAAQMQWMVARFTGDVADRAAARQEYCRYTLDRILDGLEARLSEIVSAGSAPR
ncbi:TetR/AcrR family transcriptional regulator [Micromonospora andamanensis]|uniref:TetR family transcriptional regulator n=1 Tax=Micromonospora andamanensis TaxID=1287068 RepID=A0ABQ4I1X8_9ACTN|nr:TetR/AcrR family transcriptional regulator [Micromonospora andamanensis]GIJ11904.1 TetR family transcriptional regulator [Micromonospora andamanensis]GIJ41668.1 TetR family transcriptional regulator [Micromonospora andamanensis]